MTTYKKGDVVVTLFPYADSNTIKQRPALVCGGPWKIGASTLYWVCMITSTKLKGWDGDIDIPNQKSVGLNAPSIVRTLKMASVDSAVIGRSIGALDAKTWKKVQAALKKHVA